VSIDVKYTWANVVYGGVSVYIKQPEECMSNRQVHSNRPLPAAAAVAPRIGSRF
jgi:hypothetical protein